MSKNVAAKVLKMIKNVGEIPRNGWNERFKYKFTKETDVSDALRKACCEVGLVMVPSIHDVSYSIIKTANGGDQYRASLMLKLTLIDPDSGESIEMDFPGDAMDMQDKALPKAITSAHKYALIKLSLNGGGEGDDLEHEDEGKTGKSSVQDKPKPVESGATYRKPAETDKSAPKADQSAPKTGPQPAESKPAPATTGGNNNSTSTTKPPTEKPKDKPLSMMTAPDEVPTYEATGKILAVIPAMKGKPATISFRPDQEGATAMVINFDPAKIDVPTLLKLQQSKSSMEIVCDVSGQHPFLMHFTNPNPTA